MTYNIHPLFVHFPIAFLLLYSLIRILPFERLIPSLSWRHIQQVLLLAGILGAFLSNTTGELAEHLVRPEEALVEMHAFFALASTWIYGLLLGGEILFILNPYLSKKLPLGSISTLLIKIEKLLTNRTLTLVLALLGVVAISLTGLLGGVMVYGTSADPLAPVILKILGLA
ncbi:MAG: hypothetical protein KBB75_00510 [Candidatus Pacebacteria bacterium]|jgi:uncharacterized membrane protein|nr:hypothetical protein [Candidatus Paceibacterota bacterium]MBP9816338.1 hypothetical protein [Candidatus Woesebacteria bacterium]